MRRENAHSSTFWMSRTKFLLGEPRRWMAGDQCGLIFCLIAGREGTRPGPAETGTQVFCNVGPLSDSDETVCARRPKCLRWVLTALLLTAINTGRAQSAEQQSNIERVFSADTHIGSDSAARNQCGEFFCRSPEAY